MKKLKRWQFILLIIFYPIGVLYFAYWFFVKKKKTDFKKQTSSKKKIECINTKNIIKDESTHNYDLFETIEEGYWLRYEYEENMFIDGDSIQYITGNGGEYIKFEKEPDNEYDKKAIAIYLNDRKIGYVYRGNVQNMINDWISRNDLFMGYINKIDVNQNKVTYKIGFYKPLKIYESIVVSLIKTNTKIDDNLKREDNLYNCEEGQQVYFEESDNGDSYVVYNYIYEEIGELSTSVYDKIVNMDCKDMIGTIESFEFNDTGKPKVKLRIYFVK